MIKSRERECIRSAGYIATHSEIRFKYLGSLNEVERVSLKYVLSHPSISPPVVARVGYGNLKDGIGGARIGVQWSVVPGKPALRPLLESSV